MDRAWAGVDIGKGHHHVAVLDADGRGLLSQRVANDEPALARVIEQVTALAGTVTWAIDLHGSESALLVAMLLGGGQRVVYVPGLVVNRAASSYRGCRQDRCEGRACDRRPGAHAPGPGRLHADEELVVELRMLTARRHDLASDRTGR